MLQNIAKKYFAGASMKLLDEITLGHDSIVDLRDTNVVVFVGANNSGKSTVLREIHRSFSNSNYSGLILKSKSMRKVPSDEVEKFFNEREVILGEGRSYLRTGGDNFGYDRKIFGNYLRSGGLEGTHVANHADIISHLVKFLDGSRRLSITESKDRDDLKNPSNSFSRLLVSEREK